MSFHHIPCGECFFCERRMFSQCKLYKSTGLTADYAEWRGFGEYVKQCRGWRNGNVALPDNVSFEEATFIDRSTRLLRQCKRRDWRPEKTVLIIGAAPSIAAVDGCPNRGGSHLYERPVTTRREKS